MTRSHVVFAYRSLRRNPVYFAVNLIGLSMGIACCLLVFMFVEHEFSFDRYHQNGDHVYRLVSKTSHSDRWSGSVQGDPVPRMREESPAVRDAVKVMWSPLDRIRLDDRAIMGVKAAYTESNLFNIFTTPLRSGDPASALDRPNTAVLGDKLARRIFGAENPIGQVVSLELVPGTQQSFEITGVMDDAPPNSHLEFNLLLSWETLRRLPYCLDCGQSMYVLLEEDADPEHVARMALTEIRDSQGKITVEDVKLEPLSEIHFSDIDGRGDIGYVVTLSLIALLVLAVACFNYANLTMARSVVRAKEVGIRKLFGAIPSQVAVHYLVETVVLASSSLPIAALLVYLVLPAFNDLAGTEVTPSTSLGPLPIVGIPVILLFVALVGGAYPSFHLSRMKVTEVVSGQGATGRSSSVLGRLLLIAQFTVSIVLVVMTLVAFRQVQFMSDRDPGFATERVLITRIHDHELAIRPEFLKDQFLASPIVGDATAGIGMPGTPDFHMMRYIAEPAHRPGEYMRIDMPAVDAEFVRTFELELLAGRNLSDKLSGTRVVEVVANEALVQSMGWESPEAALGKLIDETYLIVGVVADFNYESLRGGVNPMMLALNQWGQVGMIALRISVDLTADVLAGLRDIWSKTGTVDPFEMEPLSAVIGRLYEREARAARVLGAFALVTIVVSWLGLIGLVGYTTARRTREIGMRKVMGATTSDILRMVILRYTTIALVSFAAATPLAYILANDWLASFSERISLSLGSLLLVCLAVLSVTILTVAAQAFRAAVVKPVDSLRQL